VGVARSAEGEALKQAYGVFQQEALQLNPDYQPSLNRRQFAQRLRRVWEWAQAPKTDLPPAVRDKLLKLKAKAPQFTIAFALPEAARTSNQVDRLMHYQDRLLYAMQYFHGTGFRYHDHWLQNLLIATSLNGRGTGKPLKHKLE
jgi:hypothetical protein